VGIKRKTLAFPAGERQRSGERNKRPGGDSRFFVRKESMSLVRVQSEEPNLKKPAFEQAFCFSVCLFPCGRKRVSYAPSTNRRSANRRRGNKEENAGVPRWGASALPYVTGSSPVRGAKFKKACFRAGFLLFCLPVSLRKLRTFNEPPFR
jgi:hypothetical protein